MASPEPGLMASPVVQAKSDGSTFAHACANVIEYLKQAIPMGFWAVTRYDGVDQVYLEVRDDAYGLAAGDAHRWEDSFCINMVAGRTPQIAPDAMAVPEYAAAGVARQIDIGSYVGVPLVRSDGELFGTLCGLDPAPQSDDLAAQASLIQLLAGLLSSILDADVARSEQLRALERAELHAEADQLTGLLNRWGWQRYMELEEARFRRFGDPGAVMVIDLDQLKSVNDTHGHAAGDDYIVAASRAICATVRSTDVVARLGGDEFGVIAPKTSRQDCETLAQRIRQSLHDAGVAGSLGFAPLTIVAGFPGAVAAADDAMYQEKARRRDAGEQCAETGLPANQGR